MQSAQIHGLACLSLSQHATRDQSVSAPFVGLLFGYSSQVNDTQQWHVLQALSASASDWQASCTSLIQQHKSVYSSQECIGWYSTGQVTEESVVSLHRRLPSNVGPVYLQVFPAQMNLIAHVVDEEKWKLMSVQLVTENPMERIVMAHIVQHAITIGSSSLVQDNADHLSNTTLSEKEVNPLLWQQLKPLLDATLQVKQESATLRTLTSTQRALQPLLERLTNCIDLLKGPTPDLTLLRQLKALCDARLACQAVPVPANSEAQEVATFAFGICQANVLQESHSLWRQLERRQRPVEHKMMLYKDELQ